MGSDEHFHSVGVCRGHSAQNLGVYETLDEALAYVLEGILDKFQNSDAVRSFEITGRTNTILEVNMISEPDGVLHDMFMTYRRCNAPIDFCKMQLAMEVMTATVATMSPEELINELQNAMGGALGRPSLDGDLGNENDPVDPSLYNSIEEFLKNQGGDGPTN